MTAVVERQTTLPSLGIGGDEGGGMFPPISLRKTGDDGEEENTGKGRGRRGKTKAGVRIPIVKNVHYQEDWSEFDHLDQISEEQYKKQSEIGRGYINFLKLAILQETALGLGQDYQRAVHTTDTKKVRVEIAEVVKQIADVQKSIAGFNLQKAAGKREQARLEAGLAQLGAKNTGLEVVEQGLSYQERSILSESRLPELKDQVSRALHLVESHRRTTSLERNAAGVYTRATPRPKSHASHAADGFPINELNQLFDWLGFPDAGASSLP